jgi:uncharacterized protein (DUF58 family)
MSITGEGCYYFVVFAMVMAGALVREVNLLLLLAGMLVGPLLLSRFLALRTLSGLTVERRLPEAVCAGDLLVVNLQLVNPRRGLGCWSIVVEDTLTRANAKNGRGSTVTARVLFPYVPARQSGKEAYRGRLMQRGQYRLGPLKISTRFPFGLFRFTVSFKKKPKATSKATDTAATDTVLVLPRLGKLSRRWMLRQHESFSGTHHRERTPGRDGDFYGVRPWQRGDSRRWLHARTTARVGVPMVRQFEQPRNRDLALVIDLWHSTPPSAAQLQYVELAVSFAATAISDLCRRGGSDVYLIMADALAKDATAKPAAVVTPVISGGPASAALMQEMLARLALVGGHESDMLAASLDLAASRVDAHAELVVITTRACDLNALNKQVRLNAEIVRRIQNRTIRVIDASSSELSQYFTPD